MPLVHQGVWIISHCYSYAPATLCIAHCWVNNRYWVCNRIFKVFCFFNIFSFAIICYYKTPQHTFPLTVAENWNSKTIFRLQNNTCNISFSQIVKLREIISIKSKIIRLRFVMIFVQTPSSNIIQIHWSIMSYLIPCRLSINNSCQWLVDGLQSEIKM